MIEQNRKKLKFDIDSSTLLTKEDNKVQELMLFSLSYRFMQLCLVLLIGIGIGYLYFITFTSYANNCSVAIVSANKIISLEQERIKTLLDKEKDLNGDVNNNKEHYLFFDQTEEALMLMNKIGKSYENKKTKVLFVKDNFARGKGTINVSEQVHKQIIKTLDLKKASSTRKITQKIR